MYNVINRCISSKHSPNHSKSDDQNVLAHPDRPWETAKPVKLAPDSPKDQDREERRKDEGESTAGNGSNERNEVIEVRNGQSYTSCSQKRSIKGQCTIFIISALSQRTIALTCEYYN